MANMFDEAINKLLDSESQITRMYSKYQTEALEVMDSALDSFWITLCGVTIFNDEDSIKTLATGQFSLKRYRIHGQIFAGLTVEDRLIRSGKATSFNARYFLNTSYECVRRYALAVGKFKELQGREFFLFGRLIRNAYSHNNCFCFRDKPFVPINWMNGDGQQLRIDESMEGMRLEMTDEKPSVYQRIFRLDFDSILDIHFEMAKFIKGVK